jgi:hypothetical protein
MSVNRISGIITQVGKYPSQVQAKGTGYRLSPVWVGRRWAIHGCESHFGDDNSGRVGLIDSCFRRNDNREIYESGTGTGAWIQTFAGTELNCGGPCMPVNRISGMITRARLVRCTFCLKSISISSADSRFLLSQERQCRHVLVLYRQGRLSDHGHWMK